MLNIIDINFAMSYIAYKDIIMNKSFEILVNDLKSIGLNKGDTVMVHSSFSLS